MSTRKLVLFGVLTAMGFLLMLLEMPLPFLPVFLKYDPGEVPAIIAAGLFGPVAGIWVTLGKSLLFLLSGKGADGLIGAAASFVAGTGLTLGAVAAYSKAKGNMRLPLGIIGGTLGITVCMSLANYFVFLPLYGVPGNQLMAFTLSAVIPFNLIKGLLSSIIGLTFYEKVLLRVPWFARVSRTGGRVDSLKTKYQH